MSRKDMTSCQHSTKHCKKIRQLWAANTEIIYCDSVQNQKLGTFLDQKQYFLCKLYSGSSFSLFAFSFSKLAKSALETHNIWKLIPIHVRKITKVYSFYNLFEKGLDPVHPYRLDLENCFGRTFKQNLLRLGHRLYSTMRVQGWNKNRRCAVIQ